MLDGGKDAVRLDPPHVGGGQTAREQWILGIALEVAAGQGRTMEIDRGGQQAPTPAIECFLADQRAQTLGRRRVPGGADGCAARNADGGRSPASGQPAPSCSRRPVGDVHFRYVESGDGPGREQVLSCCESSLLFESQRTDKCLDICQFVTPYALHDARERNKNLGYGLANDRSARARTSVSHLLRRLFFF